MVRSLDMQRFLNLPLPVELKARLEAPGGWGPGVGPKGCADASLYQRLQFAGLTDVKKLPQIAAYDDQEDLQNMEANVLPLLAPVETTEWRGAVAKAMSEGTYFHTLPFHCGSGTKPLE
jgi:hypothetical protein